MSYQALASQDPELFLDEPKSISRVQITRQFVTKNRGQLFVLLLGVIAFAELGAIFNKGLVCITCVDKPKWNMVYSPANEAVEYHVRTHYGDAVDNVSPGFWGPPSPEVDQHWQSLSSYSISKIPKNQAALLPNKTSPIPSDRNNYVAGLDVFHQLHCLNMIRQALHPEYYPKRRMNTTYGDWHIRHCVDSVRQSLMCSADISVIVWQWSDELQETFPRGNIAHTCRNYEKIQDWAKERVFDFSRYFDYRVHTVDDLVIPIYHSG
ncbi:hypothetical protein GALMADRAFT_215420 [Galerina marginata CBS 339.88]|uniref:Tat pathway signal sequence n=1 Tax=Galerina marginata (strain CBS 339.88) TaxID=685588 RepID=A0A067SE01_GALM3|nr:hypothetical protein GALMADRAFT_215420 [Galerina marginata CBS 339.88]